MLKKGYLAGNSMYPCIAHTQEILDDYFFELDKVFAQIRDFEDKDITEISWRSYLSIWVWRLN